MTTHGSARGADLASAAGGASAPADGFLADEEAAVFDIGIGAEDLRPLERRPDAALGRFLTRRAAVDLLLHDGRSAWEDERITHRAPFVEGGWLTEDGEPTPSGARLRADLAGQACTLRLEALDAAGALTATLSCGRAFAVVVAGTERRPHLDEPEAADDIVSVDVVPASAVPLLLARWGGLTPTWSVGDRLAPLDDAAFRRRLADPAEPPPPGADADIEAVWQRPWTLWRVCGVEAELELEYLNAGDRGQLVPRRTPDGRIRLVSRPGSLVWGDLQQVYGRLPAGRECAQTDW